MRVLLDECLPHRLKADLPDHEVRTTQDDPRLARITSTLAAAYQNDGQCEKAEKYHRRSLVLQEKVLPAADPANVEDRFGHFKFLIFYLLCGLAATGAQLSFSLGSDVPNLGASGAIAGVLGAHILMFPQGR